MSKVIRVSSVFLLFFMNVYAELTTTTSRFDFPSTFVFGAGTSAYQVEGAAAEDGRKPSMWDTYSHQEGNIASDQYHHFKDDVKLMDKMSLDAYRFSISWSRLIPDGHGAINPKGIKYYNDLIDELANHGIEAHVTLSHFDIPQALQDEYEGVFSSKFIEDFTAYADVCFKEFGDRVNSWITFNEPNAEVGFSSCFTPLNLKCVTGDLQRETYIPAHNVLLSHAAAVHLYRTKYQEKQKGWIGITLMGLWFEPLSKSPLDVNVAEKELVFKLDWFLEPLVYGRYPSLMRKNCGSLLPNMTEKNSAQIKGSFDFIGLNHYFGVFVRNDAAHGLAFFRDSQCEARGYKWVLDGHFLPTGLGLQKLLAYIQLKYNNPVVLIHENGYATQGDGASDPAVQNDTARISYLQTHIGILLSFIRTGLNARGYFVWSFLDCLEFDFDTDHYGLYGVDFSDKNRRRYPRMSAHWYSSFLAKSAEAHSYAYGK